MSALLAVFMLPVGLLAQNAPFILKSKSLTVELSKQGKITGMTFNKSGVHKAVVVFTAIQSFISAKDIAIPSADKKSVRFEHHLYSDSLKQSCMLVETFKATANSIRWKMEIYGEASAWSSIIKTVVQYPAGKESRFWTSWGEPQFDSAHCDSSLLASLTPYKNYSNGKGWMDPLVPVPFSKQTLYYGAPPFDYKDIKAGFIPFQGNLFAIPFASVFEKQQGVGLSVFLSPDDDIINLLMKTGDNGSFEFERLFNKVSREKKLTFSLTEVCSSSASHCLCVVDDRLRTSAGKRSVRMVFS